MLAWVMIAIAALGFVVAEDVTRLLFGYGSIGEDALERTAATLTVFMVGLTAHSLIAVVARAFYAHQDTATPVAAALVAVGSNIVLGIALVGPFGLTGLAAAIAVSAWLELTTLVVLLRRRLPGLGLGHVGVVMAKSAVASALGAAAALVVTQLLLAAWGESPGALAMLLRAGLAVAAGSAVILAGSLALRIDEPRLIVGVVVDLLRRRGRA
jgi:putative peptidoglycan lipid II flippase